MLAICKQLFFLPYTGTFRDLQYLLLHNKSNYMPNHLQRQQRKPNTFFHTIHISALRLPSKSPKTSKTLPSPIFLFKLIFYLPLVPTFIGRNFSPFTSSEIRSTNSNKFFISLCVNSGIESSKCVPLFKSIQA